jgi:hypothetical protein
VGFRQKIGGEHCAYCKWHLLCCHDGHVRGFGIGCGLRELWTVAAARLDPDMLGVPILHDGNQKIRSMACRYGVLYHLLYCICESRLDPIAMSPILIHLLVCTAKIYIESHSGLLRSAVPKTCSIYATCEKSARGRAERWKDQSSRVR